MYHKYQIWSRQILHSLSPSRVLTSLSLLTYCCRGLAEAEEEAAAGARTVTGLVVMVVVVITCNQVIRVGRYTGIICRCIISNYLLLYKMNIQESSCFVVQRKTSKLTTRHLISNLIGNIQKWSHLKPTNFTENRNHICIFAFAG